MLPGAGEALQKMFKDLADESGYAEIEFAPIIAMGHSANGQFAWNVPKWNAGRTIAAIPIKTVPLPKSLDFEGVPLCYLVGQTTEWPQYRDGRPGDRDFFWPVVRDSAVGLRSADANNLVGVVTDPGGGHFDWSEHQAQFVALYIRKACKYRLPENGPQSGPVKLKTIDLQSGWLTDAGGMEPDRFEPAPYSQYKGDPKKAYWFFDAETARAAADFQGDRKKRLRQMLTFVQDGQALPVAKQGFAPLKFQPEADGLTFKVQGDFLAEMPAELIGAGEKLGHAPGPIKFRVITGPAIQIGQGNLPRAIRPRRHGRTDLDARGTPGRRPVSPRSAAGANGYSAKSRQRQAPDHHLSQDRKSESRRSNPSSCRQPPIQACRSIITSSRVRLRWKATLLKLTPIPVRSKYPLKVTVMAYQWGRIIEPLFQSAEPVEQSF